MARKTNMAKLMEKIAKAVNVDATELQQKAKDTQDLYSHDEAVMQRQAVINFFTTYVAPEEPRQRQGETKLKFAERLAKYHNEKNEWKFATCEGCKERFVYAYHYRGVRHCSLECLDATLRKIGISLTIGRDLKKRWGQNHPAVVPADALKILEQIYGPSAESSDVPEQSSQHKSHTECSPEEQMQGTQT